MAYFVNSSNFTTYGILTNSGGATFTNGLTVSAGANLSYDPSHMLDITATGTTITGDCDITGALSLNTFSIGSDISFTNLTQTSIVCKKSLVLGQTGDQFGSAYLTLQSRNGFNGALFQTSDPTVTLVDFGFLMTNGVQRNLRLEGRAPYAKCGAPSFLLGGTDLIAPSLAVGDTYSAIAKLAIGSYTSPGTNALTVTGNVSMPGYMFCAGLASATGTKLTSTGQVGYTLARLSGYAVGVWTITFASAHPLGANYIVTPSARGCFSYISTAVTPTSTSFVLAVINPATVSPIDGIFSFMVLAS